MAIMPKSIHQLHTGIMQNTWQINCNHAHTHSPATHRHNEKAVKKQLQPCPTPYPNHRQIQCNTIDQAIEIMQKQFTKSMQTH
jgi:hypothetical protein